MDSLLKIFDRILCISIFIQALSFPYLSNIYALFITFIGWRLLIKYASREKYFKKYPMIALTLTALAFFYFFLPPIVTLFEVKPVVFNLKSPYLTYSLQIIYIYSLLIAFWLSKQYNQKFIPRFLKHFNFYYIPSKKGIWLIGLMGLASLIFSNSHSDVFIAYRSAFDRFFEAFSFMSAAPLIFFCPPEKIKKRIGHSSIILLILYLIILLFSAIMTNRRSKVLMYILIPILLSATNKILEDGLKTIKSINVIIFIILVLIISTPASNFALAMISQRAFVKNIKGVELLTETWKAFNDKELIKLQKTHFLEEQEKYSNIKYTEYYVNNIFLNRLCNMKPIDNSVTYASMIDCIFGNDFMQKKFKESFEGLLPRPILRLIDPSFDKFKEIGHNLNDYLINTATYSNGGGYRVGGDTGIAFAVFGVFFPFVVMFFYSLLFLVINSFQYETDGIMIYSIFASCQLFKLFFCFQTRSGLASDLQLLFRVFPQEILLYLIIINYIKKIGW